LLIVTLSGGPRRGLPAALPLARLRGVPCLSADVDDDITVVYCACSVRVLCEG